MMTTIRRSLLVFVSLVASLSGEVEAAFVTYTETATGSGTLGTTTFTNAALTFTQTAETANVIYVLNGIGAGGPGDYAYAVGNATATITIAGVGTASFTGQTSTFNDVTKPISGLEFGGPVFGGSVILGFFSPALPNYDLRSSIGPVASTTVYFGPMNFATNLGNFTLSSTTDPATFQANVVPEPSSLTLGTIAALVGLGVRARRRALVA